MQRYLQNYKTFSLLVLLILISLISKAQPTITGAKISDSRSNYLEVTFSENISVSNANGFRLTGGSARIKSLLGGSGSNQLIFSLTNYVLPDDNFSLLHWKELSDAVGNSGRLNSIENFEVDNQVKTYHGDGNIWYVSISGNDQNNGTSPQTPLKTIDKAQELASAGDFILLKRGDTFTNTFVIVNKSGNKDRYLSFSAYGSGAKPILEHDTKDIFTVEDQDYVLIDNFHLKVSGNGETGVYLSGNSSYTIVSNCKIEGFNKPHHGVNFGKLDGGQKAVTNPIIINNFVSGFRWNIRSSGYPYDGTHEVIGGIIENNISAGNYTQGNDGISAQRGKYHGLMVRKNEVYGWYDDGMDFYAAEDVTIEFNTLHSPQQPANSGQAIKAGGITRTEPVVGHTSKNITVRYNTVYNLYNNVSSEGSHNGIQTNSGGSGKIYGNLVYDVRGNGIVVSGPIEDWEVYNNTVINAENIGIRVWTEGNNDHNVKIYNNILQGKNGDIVVTTNSTKQTVNGKNNILLSGNSSGNYSSSEDRSASIQEILVNPANNDFSIKSHSLVIDKGVSISNYTKDRIGTKITNLPDIGAFEYNDGESVEIPESPESPEPSPSPEPEVPTDELISGLNYKYYEGSWSTVPDFEKLNAIKTGIVSNFSLSPHESNEHFGFLFTGYIKIETTGTYTFYTNSDDGSLLYIDGDKVVDNNGTHGPRERSGSVSLSAGYHAIEVGFFENVSGQILEVNYSGPGVSKKIIPSSVLFSEEGESSSPSPEPEVPTDELSNGLNYEYYEGKWTSVPNFNELESVKTGNVSNFSLSPRVKNEHFGFLFKGYINIQTAGTYTFYTNSDDGSVLYINSTKIVDNDGTHGPRERSGSVSLSAGYHAIEVGFFENVSGQILEVSYSGPGASKKIIPSSVLFREVGESASPSPDPEPVPDTDVANGVNYKYYEGRWTSLPNFGSLQTIKSGTVSNFDLSPHERDDHYAFEFTSYIKIESSGSYTFYTNSDDGSRLFINDSKVVENDGVHATQEQSGTVSLSAGYHAIKVTYFERSADDVLNVSYSGPGVSKKAIPSNVLFLSNPSNARMASTSKGVTADDLENELAIEAYADEIINVYPVPFDDYINIELSSAVSSQYEVVILDITGKPVFTQTYDVEVGLQDLQIETYDISASGIYIMSIYQNGELKESKRLLKN